MGQTQIITYFFPIDISPYKMAVPNIKALAINVLGPKQRNNGIKDDLKRKIYHQLVHLNISILT